MKEYQGHRSYNAWNIALWMGNDEGIYRFAMDCLEKRTDKGNKPSLKIATRRFMEVFENTKTPDGVKFTTLNVKLGLQGLQD